MCKEDHPPIQRQSVERQLDTALKWARQGRTSEALGWMDALLEPVIEDPLILRTWIELTRQIKGKAYCERILKKIGGWHEVLNGTEGQYLSAEEPVEGTTKGTVVSKTLARLFWDQGHIEEALNIYRRLIEQNPEDEQIREELQRCEVKLKAPPGQRMGEEVDRPEMFRQWIEAIRVRRSALQKEGIN